MGTIPPGGNPKDGIVNENNLNQMTQLHEKKKVQKFLENSVQLIKKWCPLLALSSCRLESLPFDYPMEMDLHGAEGKKVAKKEKNDCRGL